MISYGYAGLGNANTVTTFTSNGIVIVSPCNECRDRWSCQGHKIDVPAFGTHSVCSGPCCIPSLYETGIKGPRPVATTVDNVELQSTSFKPEYWY